MSQRDFKIVNDDGKVSIVRSRTSSGTKPVQTGQRMRVMCFDSARIDRIFSIQEKAAKNSFKR